MHFRRGKHGVTLKAIAELTGEHLSSIKRQSAKDPEALLKKVAAITKAGSHPAPDAELLLDVIWRAHMALVTLRTTRPDLSGELSGILAITSPIIAEM
jgi:hypothetical protein